MNFTDPHCGIDLVLSLGECLTVSPLTAPLPLSLSPPSLLPLKLPEEYRVCQSPTGFCEEGKATPTISITYSQSENLVLEILLDCTTNGIKAWGKNLQMQLNKH